MAIVQHGSVELPMTDGDNRNANFGPGKPLCSVDPPSIAIERFTTPAISGQFRAIDSRFSLHRLPMNEHQARKNALICTFMSMLLLVVNHLSLTLNGMGYYLLPYVGCVGILFGAYGYLETDIYRFKDDWGSMSPKLKYMMFVLLAVGLSAGYCLNRFVYLVGR